MTVVQRLRQTLHLRFGGMDRLPHLHLMVLDTDPEMVRAATRGPGRPPVRNRRVAGPAQSTQPLLKAARRPARSGKLAQRTHALSHPALAGDDRRPRAWAGWLSATTTV